MTSIALNQDQNKQFTISYDNGMLLREDSEVSFAKHNLFCFGRLNKNLTTNPKLRRGSLASFLESREMYSISWLYYMEGNVTFEAMKKITIEFNKACDRDFNDDLFDQRIQLTEITKLDKTTVLFKIKIGDQQQDFTINV